MVQNFAGFRGWIEGLGGNSVKFCTSEKFPLYSMFVVCDEANFVTWYVWLNHSGLTLN